MDFGFNSPFDNPFHRDPVYLEGIDRRKHEDQIMSDKIQKDWDRSMNLLEVNYNKRATEKEYKPNKESNDTEEEEEDYLKDFMKLFNGDRGVFFLLFLIFIVIVHVIISNYKACKKHTLIEFTS